uniref:Uncharacterized protein n=1 Tax=Arundo donax TaxID=35708 RepID=A0A0A9AZG0_ARUDO
MPQPGSRDANSWCLVACISSWPGLTSCKQCFTAWLSRYVGISRFSSARLTGCKQLSANDIINI